MIPFPYTSRKHHPIPHIFVQIRPSLHRSHWLWRRRSPRRLDLWNFHVPQCLLRKPYLPGIGQQSQEMWIRMRFEACQQIEISWIHLPAKANLLWFTPRGSQPARIMSQLTDGPPRWKGYYALTMSYSPWATVLMNTPPPSIKNSIPLSPGPPVSHDKLKDWCQGGNYVPGLVNMVPSLGSFVAFNLAIANVAFPTSGCA